MKLAPTVALAAIAVAALVPAARSQQPALDPEAAGPAERIWAADTQEQQRVWFRRRLALPEGVTTARLVFTCDNEGVVFVNGAEVARSTDWEEVTVVDVAGLGRDNVIAVEATNTGGPAALACWVLWTDQGGGARELVTDPNWRVTTAAAAGWATLEFDDAKWAAATSSYTSTFGLNLYNGHPRRVRFHGRFADAAATIEAALQDLRAARDVDAAAVALDRLERAVMAARRLVWAEAGKPGVERKR